MALRGRSLQRRGAGVEDAPASPAQPPIHARRPREASIQTRLGNALRSAAPDDRDHIELHFREHWSLYDYDTHGRVICTAEDFITHINRGGRQGGAIEWRYVLVDERVKIPATSLWTMCEIWSAVCCRVKTKALGVQGHCSRLSRMLAFKFGDLVLHTIPVPYDEFTDEVNEWIFHKDGHQLAAWIDLFIKASHNALHEVQAPDRLRPELARMADRALKQMASDSADPDEAMLLHRIQQEPDLAWNPTDGTFGSEPPPARVP